MVPFPLPVVPERPDKIQNGSELFKYTSYNQDNPVAQPPVRKAPRKPAPPVPPITNLNSHELLRTNNNDYCEEGNEKKVSPIPSIRSSGHKPSFRSSAFAIGSSSETIDSCGSRSPIQNGDIGSLDRSVIRRNSSERRPTQRNSLANHRASKLIGKPSIPPPSIPRRPNVPPPGRPEKTGNELSRQRSADNLSDEYSSQSSCRETPVMSKSFSVSSPSSQNETKGVDEEKEEGGDEVIQVENTFSKNVIRVELNTSIETPVGENNGKTLVTRRSNSSEEHQVSFPVEDSYETEISAHPSHPVETKDPQDDNSNTSAGSPTGDTSIVVESTSNSSLTQELNTDQVKVKPPKPLPPPIKPRMNLLNEASRL